VSKRQISNLSDKALDDLATKTNKPQAPKKQPERTSPAKPVNNW